MKPNYSEREKDDYLKWLENRIVKFIIGFAIALCICIACWAYSKIK
jgi:hypothetical protein